MRNVIRLTVGVLVAAGLCLTSVVWAQKVKTPPTKWTFTIIGAEGVPTIIGGLGGTVALGADVVYDPSVNSDLGMGIGWPGYPDRANIYNFFNLEIRNPDPLAVRTPANQPEPTAWISFRNLAMDPAGADQNWGPYTENADRLGPVELETGGWVWPFLAPGDYVAPDGPPEYQARFLNAESHPRRYYTAARLGVRFVGPSFLELQQDIPLAIEPDLWATTVSKRDCLDPEATEIGMATGTPPGTYESTITRTGENTWRIDVERPIKLIEVGTYPYTFRNKTSCKTYLAGGWWTTPVKFTMVVTRHVG